MGNLYDQEGHEVEVVDSSQKDSWYDSPDRGPQREHVVSDTEECWCEPERVYIPPALGGESLTELEARAEFWDAPVSSFDPAAFDTPDVVEVSTEELNAMADEADLPTMRSFKPQKQGPVEHSVWNHEQDGSMRAFETEAHKESKWFEPQTVSESAMRAFATGATRNVEVDPDLYGFTSPLALAMFGRYMHENRTQADGTLRDSDNWKQGIPLDSYIRSMRRHLQDLTMHHDGYGNLAREDLDAALAGLFFNVQGYMHEVAKANLNDGKDI